MNYNPNLRMPTPEVVQAVNTVRQFAYDNSMGDEWSILGLGPVYALQRQLAAVTAERDKLAAAVERVAEVIRKAREC